MEPRGALDLGGVSAWMCTQACARSVTAFTCCKPPRSAGIFQKCCRSGTGTKRGSSFVLSHWKVHFIDQRFVITRSERVGSCLAGWVGGGAGGLHEIHNRN
ncbi:hypothetical protein Q8A73_005363 [Channa argus]|nr:hypothetical protein Q8A73_005363 [Channa argus]